MAAYGEGVGKGILKFGYLIKIKSVSICHKNDLESTLL
jgi:hypothetical protein